MAFLIGLVPGFGAAIGLAAILFGVLALSKIQSKPMAITGMSLGLVAALTSIVVLAALISGGSEPEQPVAEAEVEVSAAPVQPDVQEAEVPAVVGLELEEAKAALATAGFEFSISGAEESYSADGTWTVQSQSLSGAQPVGAVVKLAVVRAAVPLDLATFTETDERTFGLVQKSPDAYVGTNMIVYGSVTQFDAATGACVFRANTSHAVQEMSFDYSSNTLMTAGDGESDCPGVAQVLADDHIKAWVTVAGSFTYDTQIGGSTTVPLFTVHQVEILPATEY
ncbi:PASTA domain-containing protein [Pseudoclavibacter sp. RFBB5]|uniref:PASTA domain-containing protein n=1 Tax=Pseudoclavibacter sp. RFBB5 TaxID=2080574 RepID=UPI000CE88010|nr:PASTA domain-containing protein [Pseudoclavibacter sp. RFBB5]PPG28087.1 hypothetical protein C5B97_14530 [Pseudoclavibacter sp. RFBB5]